MAFCVTGNYSIQNCLGVGTDTPAYGVDVRGTGIGTAAISLNNTSAAGRVWNIYSTGDSFSQGCGGLLFYRNWADDTSGTMYLDCLGRVGMGTTSPSNLLHVCGAPTSNGLIARFQSTASSGSISISHSGNGGNIGYANLGAGNASNTFFITTGAGTIGSGIVMDNAGSIGIGICSPSSKLTVGGDVGIGTCVGSYTYAGPSQYGAITFPRAQLLFSNTNDQAQFYFVSNATLNASSQFTYTCNGRAGKVNIDNGQISLDVAACAASGGVISWINGITVSQTGNVGINNTSPNSPLHITAPSGDGIPLLRVCATAAPSAFNWAGSIMNQCLCSNRNFVLLIGQAQSTKNSGYIGYNHTGTAGSDSNFLTFGHYGNDNLMNLMADGKLGVGTSSPSYRLHVNGTFYAAGSSIKYKEGICNYDTDSCLFMCLKPVTYQYKDEWQHLGRELKSQSQIGLIAEDVAEVMPELAVLVNEEDEKVVRNVDYEKLSVVLLKEVQKLRLEVDQLKNNK